MSYIKKEDLISHKPKASRVSSQKAAGNHEVLLNEGTVMEGTNNELSSYSSGLPAAPPKEVNASMEVDLHQMDTGITETGSAETERDPLYASSWEDELKELSSYSNSLLPAPQTEVNASKWVDTLLLTGMTEAGSAATEGDAYGWVRDLLTSTDMTFPAESSTTTTTTTRCTTATVEEKADAMTTTTTCIVSSDCMKSVGVFELRGSGAGFSPTGSCPGDERSEEDAEKWADRMIVGSI